MAADGGTITFNGNVSATTCTINAGGGATGSGGDMTVTLPSVSASMLGASGATAGRTPFSIILSGCSGSATQVSTFFANGTLVDQTTGQLILDSTSGAKNVEISLLGESQAPIVVGAPNGQQNSQLVTLNSSGPTTLKYFAQYIGTGKTVTPGSVSSQVSYSLTYQ
ncbi:fimbrial protein [Paraburkholderia lycopersici]|nr:fimbrial protein [Paraburkholderia lycopersici]